MDLTPEEKARLQRQQYLDSREFQSRFFLTPEIQGGADFTHFDKNIGITNLKHNPKLGIDEPEKMNALGKSLHILNNPQHTQEIEITVLSGYKDIDNKDGTITRIPVYTQTKETVSKFPKTYHNLKAAIFTMSITSGARNGHRVDKAISNKLVQENTLSDKTNVKSGFGFGRKNKEEY